MDISEIYKLTNEFLEFKKDIVAALLTVAWGASNDRQGRVAAGEVRGIYKNMKENLK